MDKPVILGWLRYNVIFLWCNGNTSDFGSEILGSSPSRKATVCVSRRKTVMGVYAILLISSTVFILTVFLNIILSMLSNVHPVKCYRCKYATRSKNHLFKYKCNRYVYFMDAFDYCSKGEEDE